MRPDKQSEPASKTAAKMLTNSKSAKVERKLTVSNPLDRQVRVTVRLLQGIQNVDVGPSLEHVLDRFDL